MRCFKTLVSADSKARLAAGLSLLGWENFLATNTDGLCWTFTRSIVYTRRFMHFHKGAVLVSISIWLSRCPFYEHHTFPMPFTSPITFNVHVITSYPKVGKSFYLTDLPHIIGLFDWARGKHLTSQISTCSSRCFPGRSSLGEIITRVAPGLPQRRATSGTWGAKIWAIHYNQTTKKAYHPQHLRDQDWQFVDVRRWLWELVTDGLLLLIITIRLQWRLWIIYCWSSPRYDKKMELNTDTVGS